MCKSIGVSKSFYDYIESGMREPKLVLLSKIATKLELSLEAIIEVKMKEQLLDALDILSKEAEETGGSLAKNAVVAIENMLSGNIATDKVLDHIENSDLRHIVVAAQKLDSATLKKLKRAMEALYPEVFSKREDRHGTRRNSKS